MHWGPKIVVADAFQDFPFEVTVASTRVSKRFAKSKSWQSRMMQAPRLLASWATFLHPHTEICRIRGMRRQDAFPTLRCGAPSYAWIPFARSLVIWTFGFQVPRTPQALVVRVWVLPIKTGSACKLPNKCRYQRPLSNEPWLESDYSFGTDYSAAKVEGKLFVSRNL